MAPPPTHIIESASSLSAQIVRSFKIGKSFKEDGSILSIDFDDSGEYCITSSDNGCLRLFDCVNGREDKHVFSKKYGCALARFTHRHSAIIYASTKEDNVIRYLSLHDNKYIRYFSGHTERVTCLEMSPLDDTFISASNESVRLWSLSKSTCIGSLQQQTSEICVAFDPSGLVFAVGINSNTIKLYDTKNLTIGPFCSFIVEIGNRVQASSWHSLQISNDGKLLLISTYGAHIYIVDAFTGVLKQILSGHENISGSPIDASFTPDARYVVAGSTDGKIYYWDVLSGENICALEGHQQNSQFVTFNPRYMMFASADDQNLVS